MNYQDLGHELRGAAPFGKGNTYLALPVYVHDEDGFIHTIDSVVWDPDDACFYINTKFMPEEKPNG